VDTSTSTLGPSDDPVAPATAPHRPGWRYVPLSPGPGEPHLRRDDLAPAAADHGHAPPGLSHAPRGVFSIVQLSDFQLVDPVSPLRMEFAERFAADPAYRPLLPAQRPQELLVRPAVAQLVATVSALGGRTRSRLAPALALLTGDVIDNAQRNELEWYLALLDGGPVPALWPGSPEGLADPAAATFGDYYQLGEESDRVRRDLGYPSTPLFPDGGAFVAPGLGLPWLACHGNHEALVQGMAPAGRARAALDRLAAGGRKPLAMPALAPGEDPVRTLLDDPAGFFARALEAGPTVRVSADAGRHLLGPGAFVAAHLRAGARPAGHGFDAANLEAGTAYYVYDGLDPVRLVVLDTANPEGGADGRIDDAQLAWLEERLVECHRQFVAPSGRRLSGSGPDRLVLLASHHGPETLRAGNHAGAEVVALLNRFPNVVAWLSGHTHRHRVEPLRPESGRGGLWSITTGSVADWPCQARLVELVDNGDGSLSLWSTLLDHDAPARAGDAEAAFGLARWVVAAAARHRELAANEQWRRGGEPGRGQPKDRNVELVLPAPTWWPLPA